MGFKVIRIVNFVMSILPQLKKKKNGASLVTVKNLPAMWETWVQSLSWEDPLENEMATHSNIFACRIPWTEEPGNCESYGH